MVVVFRETSATEPTARITRVSVVVKPWAPSLEIQQSRQAGRRCSARVKLDRPPLPSRPCGGIASRIRRAGRTTSPRLTNSRAPTRQLAMSEPRIVNESDIG